jgi:hypothetical protein
MSAYEITSFEGGLSPYANRGVKGSSKFSANLDIRKDTDSLSSGQALEDEGLLGISHSVSASVSQSASTSPSHSSSASPSPSPSTSASMSPSASNSRSASKSLSPSASASPSSSVSLSLSHSAGLENVFVDLIIAYVKATDGATYGFGTAGNIYRRYADGFTRNVYKDPDGAIKGAEEKPSSKGKTYLQWATDTKVMQKELPGRSDWSDVEVIAQNLMGADWHTMKQVGGANYIANGSFLALVGYDDSYTNEALDIIPGNYVKTLLERSGRAVIGTYKAGYPNKGVNGMVDCEVPLAQVGNDGDLVFTNFSDKMPARKFPGGGRVNPGGVTNKTDDIQVFDWEQTALSWIDKQGLGNMSLWGVFGGTSGKCGLYTYGRLHKEQPFTLNLEYELDVDEIGAVACIDGQIIMSYRDGSDFGVKAVNPDAKAIGIYEGLEYRPKRKRPVDIYNWKTVTIECDPLPSGASIEFWYRNKPTDAFTRAFLADGSSSYSTANGINAVFRIGSQGLCFEPRLVLNPINNESPEVRSITVYYE